MRFLFPTIRFHAAVWRGDTYECSDKESFKAAAEPLGLGLEGLRRQGRRLGALRFSLSLSFVFFVLVATFAFRSPLVPFRVSPGATSSSLAMFNPLPLLAVLSLFSTAQAAPSSISPSAAIQLATGSSMSTGQITPTFMWQSSGQLSSGPCPFTVKITDCYTMKLSSSGNLASRAFGHHYQNFDETSDPLEFTPILEEEEDDSAAVSRGVAHALLPRAADTNATTNSTTPVPTPRQRIEMLSWPPAPAGELSHVAKRSLLGADHFAESLAGTSWRYQWRTFLQRGASTSNQFFHLMQLLRRVDGGGEQASRRPDHRRAVQLPSVRTQEP